MITPPPYASSGVHSDGRGLQGCFKREGIWRSGRDDRAKAQSKGEFDPDCEGVWNKSSRPSAPGRSSRLSRPRTVLR